MRVLVDTSVLSMAFRRKKGSSGDNPVVTELIRIITDSELVMIGPIRQELLSGIRDETQFYRLRDDLQAFGDSALETRHFECAAEFVNRCRAKGIQASLVDALICAFASMEDIPIFTLDADFQHYAEILPIRLHGVRPIP